MHVKNHMAMWFLWFLWFFRVRYYGNPLYKPFCAFLVFVDLVWFLCGRICGFWSRVVFGSGLRVRSTSCGFCGSVVLPSMPKPTIARPIVLMWFLWVGGLALDADADDCASDRGRVVFLGQWSCPRCRCSMLDDCASSCSMWTAKKICPLPHFVLCSISSSLETTFTNGENDHG